MRPARAAAGLLGFALALAVGLAVAPNAAFAAPETPPAYAALRAARPSGKGLVVSNLVVERDAFRFRFESGSFQLLSPVEGRVFGAVFSGEGAIEISPASETERRHLALRTGEKSDGPLIDRFQSAVLLFSDGTAAELEAKSTAGPEPAGAAKIWDDWLRRQKKVLRRNLQLRLLRDALAPARGPGGVFLVAVSGRKLPSCLVAYDPSGLDWLEPLGQLGGEESALYALDEPNAGFWYLSPAKASARKGQRLAARASHYEVETSIQKNADLKGTTTIRFVPIAPELRVLPLALAPKLRITEATISCGEGSAPSPAAVVQEVAEEDADAAVVLPASVAPGTACRLRLAYDGRDVLQNAGDGVFVVRARESWYPNFGTFGEPATFDLTYRVPKANEVVSVGTRKDDRVEGDLRVSVWKSEQPIRVAGFNYGKFKKIDVVDKSTGLKIEVYTNPGTPDIVAEINQYLSRSGNIGTSEGPGSPIPGDLASPFASPSGGTGLKEIKVDTETLAQAALADGVNTSRVCSAYFGKLPVDHVSITEQTQWSFGQSWPSLVFLPYLAFLDGTTRQELGLRSTSSFVEQVGLHEMAHQWWGHLVGWSSYRDQWLSEGFAEFSAGLVLEYTGGLRKANNFWEHGRRWIVMKPPQANLANDAVGPISLGYRLVTPRNPSAYDAMVYSKGAYVLHMLRMMMRDPAAPKPDEAFQEMMKDFVTANSGKSPSTRDFQAAVERHMTPNLNATHDGKMDWFFRQWVEGTEIPRFKVALDIEKKDGDNYRLKGSIAQEGVSEGFRTLLPIYFEFDKGALVRYGNVPLSGNQVYPVDVVVHSAKKPKRVVANALHEVLARD
jgi:hypothetical protein